MGVCVLFCSMDAAKKLYCIGYFVAALAVVSLFHYVWRGILLLLS